MLKKITYAIATTLVLTLSGCGTLHGGAHYITDKERVSSIISNSSNKRDVYYSLGQPTRVERGDGKTSWVYIKTSSKMSAGSFIPIFNAFTQGRDYKVNILSLEFNESDNLEKSFEKGFEVTTILGDFLDFDNTQDKINSIKALNQPDIEKVRSEMKFYSLPFDEKKLADMLLEMSYLNHQIYKNENRNKSR